MKEYAIRNKRLTDEDFFRIRKEEVLPQWETSRDIENLDENIAAAYEYSVGLGRNYALTLRDAYERGIHLFQPQFGQALTEYMIDGMCYVEAESALIPVGLWNIFSDSYTRKNNYKMAALGIERSLKEGATMLNGWPIVNSGVDAARRIKRAVRSPMTLNSTDEDGRLASEIALAAGWNACNCRSVTEVMAHCKNIRLDEEIRINQYETRLAAIYHERGVPQSPHIACNLTGYDSCGFKSFVMVAQSLLGAEQGLKQIYLEFGINMNLIQDAAMMRVTKRLCEEYCARFGYSDILFIQNNNMFQGAFPARLEESCAMMNLAVAIGILGGSTTLVLKCQDEAFATPTKEGMCASVRMARQVETLLADLRLPYCGEVKEEERILELEVRAMMEKCLEAGDGDIALGLCLGVDAGWVSTMISPWKYNRGNVLLMRDTENAMRYFDTGDMPLPEEVKEYHLEKLRRRAQKEGRPLDFDMVVADLQYASRLPVVQK
jgi:methylaspartate mutase epsilon subunit